VISFTSYEKVSLLTKQNMVV